MPVVLVTLQVDTKDGQAKIRETAGGFKDLGIAASSAGESIARGFSERIGQKALDGLLSALKGAPAAMLAAAQAAIDYGSKLVDLEARTGIAIEAQQELSHAAQLVGVDFESKVVPAIGKMQQALVDAPEKFMRLGMSVKNLRAMKPEDQFQAIAEQISKIGDPAQRAAAAIEIFGKAGTALLPLLTSNIKAAREEAEALGLVMSKDVAASADDLGDSIDTLSAVWDGLVRNFGAAIVTSEPLHRLITGLAQIFGTLSKDVHGTQDSMRSFVDGGVILAAKALGVLVTAISFVIDAWTTFNIVMIAQRAAIEILVIWFMKQAEAIRHPTQAMQKLKEAFAQSTAATQRASRDIQEEIRVNGERQTKLALVGDQIDKLTQNIIAADGVTHKATGSARGHTLVLGETAAATKAAAKATEEYNQALAIANSQMRAIAQQGLARQIEMIEQSQRAGRTDLRSRIMGGREQILPQTDRERSAQRNAEMAETMGKVQALTDAFLDLGVAIFGADSLFARLAPTISSAVSAAAAFASGNIVGGIVATAQTVASMITFWRDNEAAIKANQNAMKDLTEEYADLMQAAKDAGIALDDTFDPSRPDEYREAMERVQDQLDDFNEAHRLLNEAIERYGFTFEELGPAMQRQRLHEQAAELLRDFELLSAAGIDMTAIMERMGPALSDLVQRAIATGTALPEAMRALIERMIENRTLLDENGRAYESLEETGLTFTETLEAGISRLIESIQRLVNALLGIPDRHIVVDIEERRRGAPPNPGGNNTPDSNQGPADRNNAFGGTFMPRMGGHRITVAEAGQTEHVIGDRDMRALVNAALRGGERGGGQPYILNVTLMVDGQEFRTWIDRQHAAGALLQGAA